MVIFINGLPLITFELKNNLTKQSVNDAKRQYRDDRDPKEPLFRFARCLVHFAVDDREVWMCTDLKGKNSYFLPFNQGQGYGRPIWEAVKHGQGNPVNPDGLMTAYLWQRY
jgi:type I restriction enzyme, R subunit